MNEDKPAYFRKSEYLESGEHGYWQQDLICSDGSYVGGCGMYREEAEKMASKKRDDHEAFLRMSKKEQIKKILSKYKENEYPCMNDVGYLIKALAEIVGAI